MLARVGRVTEALVTRAVDIIAGAIAEHDPVRVYALVSGGNDSTVAAHLAATFGPRVDALAHINTGIGIEETRHYVRRFADWLGLPLIEKLPPRTYEELVMEHGFPGPGAHRYMYSWLKERPLRELRRQAQTRRGERVMFLTGVRTAESSRRMGHVKAVQRDGATVWVAPILDFGTSDIWDYRERHELPANEVVASLHMSGECLCGAFAKPDELEEIAFFYPETAQRIRALEAKVRAAGVVSTAWGPHSSKRIREARAAAGMLCSSCVA